MLKSWRSQGLACVYHTHPHATSTPSTSDRKGCNALGVPFLIVGMIDESVELLYPDPIWSGLLCSSWQLGRADCVSLVERYYAACLGIDLPRHAVPTPWPPRHD